MQIENHGTQHSWNIKLLLPFLKKYVSCTLVLSFLYITFSNSPKQTSTHIKILTFPLAKAIMNVRRWKLLIQNNYTLWLIFCSPQKQKYTSFGCCSLWTVYFKHFTSISIFLIFEHFLFIPIDFPLKQYLEKHNSKPKVQ